MALKDTFNSKSIGVIGAGKFGTVIANIIAPKNPVILYARRPEVVANMVQNRESAGYALHGNITPTDDLEYLATQCEVIMPIIASEGFRKLMQSLSPYLHPYHILIHGTKGLVVAQDLNIYSPDQEVTRNNIRTMSEVITEETVVVRVGCLAGPNLAKELGAGQPAATVVASPFNEVINYGKRLLRSNWFQVYGSQDLIGIELAGVLKNIIAIASGALSGLGMGENARALLISRGLSEMIHLGKALGGNTHAFIGLAGVGDLVATCSSRYSRNFTVGYRLAKGEDLYTIQTSMEEGAEGINTIKIINRLAEFYDVSVPITVMLHKVLFEGFTVKNALDYLMKYPLGEDVDFL